MLLIASDGRQRQYSASDRFGGSFVVIAARKNENLILLLFVVGVDD
jgi:hypothetical protein